MFDHPKTLAEARKRKYGGGLSSDRPYVEGKCAFNVSRDMGRWTDFGQCERKCGYGPEELFCKQHALMVAPAEEDTITAWKVHEYRFEGMPELDPVEVVRFTERTVLLANGSREKIDGEWGRYFKSEQEARDWVRAMLKGRIKKSDATIKRCLDALAEMDKEDKVLEATKESA